MAGAGVPSAVYSGVSGVFRQVGLHATCHGHRLCRDDHSSAPDNTLADSPRKRKAEPSGNVTSMVVSHSVFPFDCVGNIVSIAGVPYREEHRPRG